jgi:PPOX class probable F420-dependent enzyme
MSRRDQIQMSEPELQRFVRGARTVILCSLGKDGFPHPMPMWFGVEDDGAIVMTTFSKSQKVRNLARDPRVSLLLEDGEEYAKLRGVVMYGRAELSPDRSAVLDVLERVTTRSGAAPAADPKALRQALEKTASKRVAIRIRPERIVSWDHAKLSGVY